MLRSAANFLGDRLADHLCTLMHTFLSYILILEINALYGYMFSIHSEFEVGL